MKKKENEIIISLNSKLYPLEAIYGAAYAFIDKAYIFLDGDPEKKVDVSLKLKPNPSFNFKDIKELEGEFFNELLNFSWRHQISKENKRLREYIVGAALLGVTGEANLFRDTHIDKTSVEPVVVIGEGKDDEAKDDFEDPLGIAIPWEEKFLKKDSKGPKVSIKGSKDKDSGKKDSKNCDKKKQN